MVEEVMATAMAAETAMVTVGEAVPPAEREEAAVGGNYGTRCTEYIQAAAPLPSRESPGRTRSSSAKCCSPPQAPEAAALERSGCTLHMAHILAAAPRSGCQAGGKRHTPRAPCCSLAAAKVAMVVQATVTAVTAVEAKARSA